MQQQSLRTSVIFGVGWMVVARWAMKGLGFISTIILARLLAPEDFGIVAMAMIIVGLTQVLFEMNVDTALIQNTRADESYFNTAWTIRIIQSTIVSILLLILSPLAARYYTEPRVVAVIQALAIGLFFNGFVNIGVVNFRKELQFDNEFRFLLLGKLAAFLPTVFLAFLWRDYWALVVGTIIGSLATVFISYLVHPFRPRYSVEKFSEIWGFSQWVLVHNIGYYTYTRIDQIVIGATANSSGLGVYSVAAEISELPTTELIYPISRVIVPSYAKIKHDPERLRAVYLKVLAVVAGFSLPAAVGLANVSNEVVRILLGEKWLEVIHLLQWLAIFAGLRPIYGTVWNLVIALGEIRRLSALTWFELICLAPATWLGAYLGGVMGVAVAKVVVTAGMPVLYFSILVRFGVVSALDLYAQLWRPVLSAAVMAAVLFCLNNILSSLLVVLALAAKVIVGAATYSVMMLSLWYLAGRPDGVENELIQFVVSHIRPAVRRITNRIAIY